ncbi:hypothetical protein [Aliamphritea spongicola]|nr:hypothetical protein [Aliamphritea spongicola]
MRRMQQNRDGAACRCDPDIQILRRSEFLFILAEILVFKLAFALVAPAFAFWREIVATVLLVVTVA